MCLLTTPQSKIFDHFLDERAHLIAKLIRVMLIYVSQPSETCSLMSCNMKTTRTAINVLLFVSFTETRDENKVITFRGDPFVIEFEKYFTGKKGQL